MDPSALRVRPTCPVKGMQNISVVGKAVYVQSADNIARPPPYQQTRRRRTGHNPLFRVDILRRNTTLGVAARLLDRRAARDDETDGLFDPALDLGARGGAERELNPTTCRHCVTLATRGARGTVAARTARGTERLACSETLLGTRRGRRACWPGPARARAADQGRGEHWSTSKSSEMGCSLYLVTRTRPESGVVCRNFEGGVVR